MEVEEEENGFHGSVPEFGAIFMCNIATKRECFKKKVMGLPLSKANFVKQVRCGMVLFLFEFERRELFGVYCASSDGGMNIVSHAFSSSGDRYPAQVRFTPIWYCSPLSESEFRGAIRDNYYSSKMFNFGLSREQVHDLLMLFSKGKLRNQLPPRQLSRVTSKQVGENSNMVDDESPAVTDGFLNEDCIQPSPVIAYPQNFWDRENELNGDTCFKGGRTEDGHRVSCSEGEYLNNYSDSLGRRRTDDDGDTCFKDGRIEYEHRVNCSEGEYLNNYSDSLGRRRTDDDGDACFKGGGTENKHRANCSEGKYLNNYSDSLGRRRTDDDGRILTNNIAGNRLNDGPLIKGVSLAKGSQFLMDDTVNNDCKNLPSAIATNDLADPVHFSANNVGAMFTSRERIVNQSNIRLTKRYGKFSNDCTSTLSAHYGRSLLNDGLEEHHNLDYAPSVSGKFDSDFGNMPRNADDQHRFIHDSTENKHLRDYVAVSAVPTTHFASRSCDINELYGDGRSPVGWNRREHNLDTFGGPGFYGRRNEYFQSRIRDRSKHENAIDFDLGPSASNEQYASNVDKQWANVDWYRKNNPEKSASFVEHSHMPHHLIGRTEMKQISPASCSTAFFETAFPQITEAAKFDSSFSKFQDAKITKALPCDHELATSHWGRSSSSQVDHGSCLVQNNSHGVEQRASTGHPGLAADYRQRARLRSQSGIDESHLNARLDVTSSKGYRDPPSSKLYRDFLVVTGPDEAALQGDYAGFPPLAFDSSSHPSFATDSPIKERLALQESNGILYHSGVPIIDHNNNFGIYEKIAVNDGTEHNRLSELSHPDYEKFKRRSVFTRLSSKKRTQKEKEIDYNTGLNENFADTSVFTRLSSKKFTQKKKEIDYNPGHDEHFIDTSVDEVMGMVQNQVSLVKKQTKCKSLVKSHDNGEITTHGKLDSVETDHNPPIISSLENNKRNAPQSIEQNLHDAPKETRAVDFKRRSELKKSLHASDTQDHFIPEEMMASERSVVKELPGTPTEHGKLTKDLISEENKMDSENEKATKRRKLVRPAFEKTDIVDEGNHQNPNGHVLHEASNKAARFVKARRRYSKSQDIIGSTNELPTFWHEHSDPPSKKQSLNGTLDNSSDPRDSSSRDPDGNISSQANGSTNVLSSRAKNHNDPKSKQRFDHGNKKSEMLVTDA